MRKINMKRINSSLFPRDWLVYSLLLLSILLGACAKPTAQIALVEPVIEKSGYEKFDLKNCETPLDDLHEPVTEYFNVKKEITIADQAAVVASGASYGLSAAEKENLAAQIETAYQKEYAAAQTTLEEQEFVVPKDRAANFSINWKTQLYKSTLYFEVKSEAYTVEYQYSLTIPEIGERTIAICGG
jgi:hypothetical protein